MWRALIVDDENLARKGLRKHVEKHFELVGEAEDGLEALTKVAELQPDLILLDIQMPEMDGIEVARRLVNGPLVLFVTAFDQHAVAAFECHALDYVLKPLDPERIENALLRAKQTLDQQEQKQMWQKFEKFMGEQTTSDKVSLKTDKKTLRVNRRDILFAESAGNYVCVHTPKGTEIIRTPLQKFQEYMGQGFLRVSRSSVVQIATVREIHPLGKGTYLLRLASGDQIRTGRLYSEEVQRALDL